MSTAHKDWVIQDDKFRFLICDCGGMQFQICKHFIMCPKCLRKYNQVELMIIQEKQGERGEKK